MTRTGVLIGDPVNGRFETRVMMAGHAWSVDDKACEARDGEPGFAASNSAAFVFGSRRYIIVDRWEGRPTRAALALAGIQRHQERMPAALLCHWLEAAKSSGAFSVSFRDLKHGVVVGGDYKKPDDATGNCRVERRRRPPLDCCEQAASRLPLRRRVVPGSECVDRRRHERFRHFSRRWQNLGALDNGKWNAVSPPFAVGPGGRIGRLRPDAQSQEHQHARQHSHKLSVKEQHCRPNKAALPLGLTITDS